MEERADFMIKSNQRPKDGKETLTCATGRVKVERIILHTILHIKSVHDHQMIRSIPVQIR